MADTRKTNPKQRAAPPGRQAGRAGGARPGQQGKAQQGKAQQGKTQQGKGRPTDGKGKLVKGAAARRLEAKRRRQRALTWTAVVVLAGLVLLGVIVWQGRGGDDQVSPEALAAARQQAGSTGVREFPEAGRNHIAPNQQADNWNSVPPTSGDHLGAPLSAGVYDGEQDERAIVHSLEHGYVVIQYKGIPEDQVAQLREFVQGRSGDKLVLAPYSALPENGVALTAWRNLETMDRVNLDVVRAFVNDFMVPGGEKSRAPEPFAP
jgi:hypothetical protein